ncbi:MAG: cytochrome c [Gammaproteobacteria bacterium]|nr:MAG: cytochrome c [Gammaproteobacteria bacterium]
MTKNILYPSRGPMHCQTFKFLVISLFCLANAIFLVPVDAQDGSALHSENCIACHSAMTGGDGSVLYTRDDRNVISLGALNKQVDRCQSSLGLNWSNNKINSVQQYLNELFYQF